jgi:hypothetical protein
MTVYIYMACEECHIQGGLVLCQSYIPENYHTQQTQNSHLKQCISWGLGDWPHPIQRLTIPLVNMQTCKVYVLYIQNIYIYIYIYFYIYIYIYWHYNPLWVCILQPTSAAIASRVWGFLITHNNMPQSVGLLWTSDQSIAETSTWQHTTLQHSQQTNIHAPGGIWAQDHSRRAAHNTYTNFNKTPKYQS